MTAIIDTLLTIFGAIFAAMMAVSEPVALAHVRSYFVAWGLAPRSGLVLGLGIAAIGLIRIAVRRHNRISSGRAIVEATRIVGSAIEDNYSERSDTVAKAKVIRNSSVRRNTLKKPDHKKGK